MRVIMNLLVVVLLVVAGCGKLPGKFGNFVKSDTVGLAQDAADVIYTTFPPAKTRLNLVQDVDDAFGAALLETLRGKGYAVAEYVQPIHRDKYLQNDYRPDGFDFGYVIDHLTGEGGMRLSLFIGTGTLSRMYAIGGTSEEPVYRPLGAWVRRQ